jgi:cytochrome c556
MFDTDCELDVCALLDALVNVDSKEEDIIQDFVWEDMKNYKEQTESFKDNAGHQGAVKHVAETADVFQLSFNK